MPIIRLGRITETPVPRAATTSTKAGAEGFATEAAMRVRFHDYRTRYNERYP
jgi:hypothetical protein